VKAESEVRNFLDLLNKDDIKGLLAMAKLGDYDSQVAWFIHENTVATLEWILGLESEGAKLVQEGVNMLRAKNDRGAPKG
jgi:hypothetical protein